GKELPRKVGVLRPCGDREHVTAGERCELPGLLAGQRRHAEFEWQRLGLEDAHLEGTAGNHAELPALECPTVVLPTVDLRGGRYPAVLVDPLQHLDELDAQVGIKGRVRVQ